MRCKCFTKIHSGKLGDSCEIHYCPLHAAAPKMYEALNAMLDFERKLNPKYYGYFEEAREVLKNAMPT